MTVTLPELAELAKKIGSILDQHGIRYHLTGGVVASHYGETRNTQDVDIVIDMPACENPLALFDDLKKEFYIDWGAFEEAIRLKSMFQILDVDSMLRADIYTTTVVPDPFSRSVDVELADRIILPIASPEDSILSKLVWIRLGSERSRKDIVAMLRVQKNLDETYLETTAAKLELDGLLKELRELAANYDPKVIF